jgi:hypothetical protein
MKPFLACWAWKANPLTHGSNRRDACGCRTMKTRQGMWESDVDFTMLECLLFQGEKVFGTNQGSGELHSADASASAELAP